MTILRSVLKFQVDCTWLHEGAASRGIGISEKKKE